MRKWIDLIESNYQWPSTISGLDLAHLIQSQDIHHTPEDFLDGDLDANICSFGSYRLKIIPLDQIKHDLFTTFDALFHHYAEQSSETAPPIIYDPIHKIAIDGNHRCKAALLRGETEILAYVGDPDTYDPVDEQHDEWRPKKEYNGY